MNQSIFKMAVTTDLHLLAKTLYDGGPAFMKLYKSDDGKQTKDAAKLIRQMFLEVHQQKNDALLITGDLTFNGELESHLELADRLRVVKNYGVPVYVLPGNHDIRRNARSYLGGEIRQVSTITEEQFAEIYEEFGYGQALDRDRASLSYTVKLRDDLYLICLDNCSRVGGVVQKYGELTPPTMEWLKRQLIRGRKENAQCIVAGHYNLAFHNSMFQTGFTMINKDEVADLLCRYDVKLYLSGHMHMQHKKEIQTVTEIASSPPTTWPHQYGTVIIKEDGSIDYSTRQIIMDPNTREAYRNFYAENFMKQVIRELLPKIEITDREIEAMAAFGAKLHLAYFSGTFYKVREEALQSPVWKLWKEKGEGIFFYGYFKSMFEEAPENHNIALL